MRWARSIVSQAELLSSAEVSLEKQQKEHTFDLFRHWGYLQADLDPLGHFPREDYPELRVSGADAERAHEILRSAVPFLEEDRSRVFHDDIAAVAALLRDGQLLGGVEQAVGRLN